MATRTTCSSSETSNEIISIKVLQYTIESLRVKVIRIYEVDGTDYLMEWTKTKKVSYSRIMYQLSPIIFMKLYVIYKSCQRRYAQILT